ncbi:hypothetical protein IQ260_04370 [Leptolyngbya cf. ectocarpi LEGE 11479]|uniref:Uncharacterized protein n=1 Tax=Leptolyngbya cf. ectocarpi LEGE 11479 TaxID=1828722 RepID=A0A928WZU7_LEPEC|nr:hypothetical protein [Leptolyngbya ectocarpi]MBE9065882.1 hypothetical protein [Leptolyngbya cf. ectocarpi LEGE 11479]
MVSSAEFQLTGKTEATIPLARQSQPWDNFTTEQYVGNNEGSHQAAAVAARLAPYMIKASLRPHFK